MKNCSILLFILYIIGNVVSYDDVEKVCPAGQKVSSVKKIKKGEKSSSVSADCGPMNATVSSPKCAKGQPLKCNGQPEGCANGTYLAGLSSYQIDPDSKMTLLVPTCCQADNLVIDKCWDERISNGNDKPSATASADTNTVFTSITCWALVDNSRQQKKLSDTIIRVKKCTYKTGQPGSGKPNSQSSSPTKTDNKQAPSTTSNKNPAKVNDNTDLKKQPNSAPDSAPQMKQTSGHANNWQSNLGAKRG